MPKHPPRQLVIGKACDVEGLKLEECIVGGIARGGGS